MTPRTAPAFKGKTFGTILLVLAQLAIGIIHSLFGGIAVLARIDYYNIYTFVFGIAVLTLTRGLCNGTNLGKIGTIIVSAFVATADLLTILDMPSIPGIPKFATYFETIYSIIVIAYLLQTYKTRIPENQNK